MLCRLKHARAKVRLVCHAALVAVEGLAGKFAHGAIDTPGAGDEAARGAITRRQHGQREIVNPCNDEPVG